MATESASAVLSDPDTVRQAVPGNLLEHGRESDSRGLGVLYAWRHLFRSPDQQCREELQPLWGSPQIAMAMLSRDNTAPERFTPAAWVCSMATYGIAA